MQKGTVQKLHQTFSYWDPRQSWVFILNENLWKYQNRVCMDVCMYVCMYVFRSRLVSKGQTQALLRRVSKPSALPNLQEH